MPYLTPQELPEEDACRPLFIPADSEWLALFGGALTELTKSWNWEYSGGLTVDETIDKVNEILNTWYEGCTACTLPGGGSAIRIRSDGRLEELLPDGSWGEPTGDYVIPPPEAREGGTSTDQKCLAAANAANVLQQLYESLADSFAEDLDEAEAVTDMIAVLIVLVGFEFAPIAFALATFLIAIFRIAYRAIEFITADLWDETFTEQLKCILFNCATNDAGVVTFDWECFNDALYEQLNDFSLTGDQLRLYGQIQIILQIIGGVDALNLAGATTAITDDNCDDCDDTWCKHWDFTVEDGGFTAGTYGVWTSGVGWESTNAGGGAEILQFLQAIDMTAFTSLKLWLSLPTNNSSNNGGFGCDANGISWSGLHLGDFTPMGAVSYTDDCLGVSVGNGGSGHFIITEMQVAGTGANPFGLDDCPE